MKFLGQSHFKIQFTYFNTDYGKWIRHYGSHVVISKRRQVETPLTHLRVPESKYANRVNISKKVILQLHFLRIAKQDVQKAIFSDAFYYWYNVSGLHFSEVSILSMADIKIR